MMKTLAAIFALFTVFALNQFVYGQDQPPAPGKGNPIVEDLAIPQVGPGAKPEYRHERALHFKGSFSERLEARFKMIMEYLKKNNPNEYERLMKLRDTDREKFAKEVWQHSPEYSETREKIAALDNQCWELAKHYKDAITEAEKTDLKSQLRPLIDQSMELVIKDTQERLEKLQKQLDEMEKDQAKVKEKRLEYFLTNEPPVANPRLRPRRRLQSGPLPEMHANPYSVPMPKKNDQNPPPPPPDVK